jgi:hypothetical protein
LSRSDLISGWETHQTTTNTIRALDKAQQLINQSTAVESSYQEGGGGGTTPSFVCIDIFIFLKFNRKRHKLTKRMLGHLYYLIL